MLIAGSGFSIQPPRLTLSVVDNNRFSFDPVARCQSVRKYANILGPSQVGAWNSQ
jgi:hypothetical protein